MPRKPWPVVSAPEGYIWGWNHPDEAHLVLIGNRFQIVCQAGYFPGGPRWMSYTAGGFGVRPCADCLKLAEQC